MNVDKPPSVGKVVIVSFLVDLLDVLTSVVVAALSGSVVMLAQVLEGLADLAASGFLLIGLARSNKPSDKKHPFGYGLELYFWTMFSAFLILGVTSTLSIYFGWQRLFNPIPITNIYLAFAILAVTTVTNGYALSLSVRRLLRGRSISMIKEAFTHSSKIETKITFVLDLTGTLASIFGLIALVFYKITGDLFFDGLGAIAIGNLLAVFGVILLFTIKELIIGQSASDEVEGRIKKATLTQSEVRNVLDLKTLHIGPEKLLVNAEVNLKDGLTTREIEKIMDKIKAEIKKEVPEATHIQVEVETP